jgi:uncharacterized protein
VTDGPRIYSLVLKVAELCNLNCSYCYMYNHEDQSYRLRPKQMSDETFDWMLRRAVEHCDRHHPHRISLSFHGGEPTLIGVDRFVRLVCRARAALGDRLDGVKMQTNALLLDDRWVAALADHGVHVGVSLDGPRDVHDATRVDHAGRGSHAGTIAGIERLQRGGIEPMILCVVSPGADGLSTYRHFRSIGIRRIAYLLPDVTHDSRERLYGGLGRTPVADYLLPIFDRWMDEDDADVYLRPFWGLIRMLLGGEADTDIFGNPPLSYLVIESDGEIQGLDALHVCKEGISRSGLNVRDHGFDDFARGEPFVRLCLESGVPLCAACRQCPERDTCGGGYLPHRYSAANGFDNPSVWCADILAMLSHIRARVQAAAA